MRWVHTAHPSAVAGMLQSSIIANSPYTPRAMQVSAARGTLLWPDHFPENCRAWQAYEFEDSVVLNSRMESMMGIVLSIPPP